MAQLILMPGKERSAFKQHHPWLFAGSVGRLEGGPARAIRSRCWPTTCVRWGVPRIARNR